MLAILMLELFMYLEEHKMKIIERIHNIKTGETVDIERDETAKEKADREALEAHNAKLEAKQAAKAKQRQALLAKLGITEDEAQLLLGGN
jgi:cell division protein FtsB